MQLFRLLMCLVFLAGISGCRHCVSCRSTAYGTAEGYVYTCAIVEVDDSTIPIFLLARSGGQGKDYSLEWETSGERCLVEGVPLKPVAEPTLYFKKDGKVKTKVIPKSGVWLSLLDEQPTPEQLQAIFELLERDPS